MHSFPDVFNVTYWYDGFSDFKHLNRQIGTKWTCAPWLMIQFVSRENVDLFMWSPCSQPSSLPPCSFIPAGIMTLWILRDNLTLTFFIVTPTPPRKLGNQQNNKSRRKMNSKLKCCPSSRKQTTKSWSGSHFCDIR